MTTVSGIRRSSLSVGNAEVAEQANQNAKDVCMKKMAYNAINRRNNDVDNSNRKT